MLNNFQENKLQTLNTPILFENINELYEMYGFDGTSQNLKDLMENLIDISQNEGIAGNFRNMYQTLKILIDTFEKLQDGDFSLRFGKFKCN